MNSGGGRAIGDEPGAIRAQLELERQAEIKRRAQVLWAERCPGCRDGVGCLFENVCGSPAALQGARLRAARELVVEEEKRAAAAAGVERSSFCQGCRGGGVCEFAVPCRLVQDSVLRARGAVKQMVEEADRQGAARLEHDVVGADAEAMTPEERRAAVRKIFEYQSQIAGVPADVLEAVHEVEKLLAGSTGEVRRRTLAHALWRAMTGYNESEKLWIESIMLRDGGRRVSFELLALWKPDSSQ